MKKPLWMLILIGSGKALLIAALGSFLVLVLFNYTLPFFLARNSSRKAKESEARTYIGSMTRAQQAFYLEKQQFAPDILTLAVGIPSETENYIYSVNPIDRIRTQNTAIPTREDYLRTYIGGVFVTKPQGSIEATTLAVLCGSNKPTRNLPPQIVTIDGQAPQCPSGYTAIN
jgi:type IV pilus assembly protein PilA